MGLFVRVMVRVTTTRLKESGDISLSIRVMVRVTVGVMITKLPESKDGKIDLWEVEKCNKYIRK